MFDAIRKHNKIIMWILGVLVFPSFIFFGIEGYGRFNEGANKVAEVDATPSRKPNGTTRIAWKSIARAAPTRSLI